MSRSEDWCHNGQAKQLSRYCMTVTDSSHKKTTYLIWFNALFEKGAIYSRRQQEIKSLTWTNLLQAQGYTTEPALTKIIKSYGSPVCRLYSHCIIILHSVPHCKKLLCISITANSSKILKCLSGRKDGKIMFNNTKQEVLQISTLKLQHFTWLICIVSFSTQNKVCEDPYKGLIDSKTSRIHTVSVWDLSHNDSGSNRVSWPTGKARGCKLDMWQILCMVESCYKPTLTMMKTTQVFDLWVEKLTCSHISERQDIKYDTHHELSILLIFFNDLWASPLLPQAKPK